MAVKFCFFSHRKNRPKPETGRKSPSSSPELTRKFSPAKMEKEEQGQGEKVKVTMDLSDSPLKKVGRETYDYVQVIINSQSGTFLNIHLETEWMDL